MKRILLLFVFAFFAQAAHSQWLTNGNNIYYNAGSVGIGTNQPTAALHLNGGGPFLKLNRSGGFKSGISFHTDGVNDFYVFSDATSSAFKIRASGIETDDLPRLHFPKGNKNIYLAESGGNVGIGTTNPGTFKLAVEGKIGAREIKVTATNWADYVFERSYRLRSLPEVEQYIRENKHLPDVPSAQQVAKEGIELGQMNATLLRKIEELTLYVIEQNKVLQEQQKQLSAQNQNLQLIREENRLLKNKITTIKYSK